MRYGRQLVPNWQYPSCSAMYCNEIYCSLMCCRKMLREILPKELVFKTLKKNHSNGQNLWTFVINIHCNPTTLPFNFNIILWIWKIKQACTRWNAPTVLQLLVCLHTFYINQIQYPTLKWWRKSCLSCPNTVTQKEKERKKKMWNRPKFVLTLNFF